MAGSRLDETTGLPTMSATFYPGQFDDWSMPQPEVISPAPQRIMPEVPTNITDSIGNMERNAQGTNDQKDEPSWSPFPKIQNSGPNIPPTDEEKEKYLESSRQPVLESNDPETQLAWAQDALTYVDISLQYLARTSEDGRCRTPAAEHQLRTDALNIVQFLADQHHPKAEFIKGTWLEFGKFGYRTDKKEAFRCYARSAERGYARAEYRMGMQYENSNEPMKAIKHYTQGAELHDSASNYRLGMMTLLGQHGQKQDFARGVLLVRMAAQSADENAPQGAYVYGMMLARELPGISVPDIFLPPNQAEAKMMIEKAAFLGFARAQVKMGQAYELCQLGCEFDPALSLHYNALASRQGEPEADMAISKWFLCGQECVFEKNEELAFKYAKQAADLALPNAEFALGYFYEIGMHVSVNLPEAQSWYRKAASHGNKDASARLDGISRSKTLSRRDHDRVAVSKIKASRSVRRPGGAPSGLNMPDPNIPPSSAFNLQGISENLPPAGTSGSAVVPPARNQSITPYPPSPTSSGPANFFPNNRPLTTGPGMSPSSRPFTAVAPGPRPASAAGGVLVPAGTYPAALPGHMNVPPRPLSAQAQPSIQQQSRPAPPPAQDMSNIPYPGFEAPPPSKVSNAPNKASKLTPSGKPSQPMAGGSPAGKSSSGSKRPGVPPVPSLDGAYSSALHLGPQAKPAALAQGIPPPTSKPVSAPAPPPAPNKLPGKGPKTFEEMGVPVPQKEQDCVVM